MGKVNLAPPELAKQYLSNPDRQKQMQLYTFDKEELLKLRRDILENPEKYEKLFTTSKGTYDIKYDNNIKKERKLEEYEYWYRVLNDGRSPTDSYPYYKEMLAYQDYCKEVEKNTVQTFLLTVNRLLMDFENQDN